MNIQELIQKDLKRLYAREIPESSIQLQKTKKEFEGNLTLIIFPLLKISKKDIEQTAMEIGEYLLKNQSIIIGYNAIKGFLNLTLSSTYWINSLNTIHRTKNYGMKKITNNSPLIMIEYSSPNTNKPLHLGHIRNILLGYSISEILKATGNQIVKTNIVNDRGIHICKSMLAWKKWGNGETPNSSGKKGDHLIGEYYVKFNQEYKKEILTMEASGLTPKEAEEKSLLMFEAREMLRKWETGDPETIHLWKITNNWVHIGFKETYKTLGVDFDKIYYESQTYLEGKKKILEGFEKGIFYKKEDGSIWANLASNGLGEKLLLRSDGTSVYITQDIGTAKLRFDDYSINKMIYIAGNEQNYHFQALSLLLDKLGFEFSKNLIHFSYGMVELPEGKMKSREGTVVDADDLIEEMIQTAKEISNKLGKLGKCTDKETNEVYKIISMGALKYFILKVDPRKNMTFNPKESIDFNGNTGPFIQYTYARIKSILKKSNIKIQCIKSISTNIFLNEKEKNIIQLLSDFPTIVQEAADNFDPSIIANYTFCIAKEYNQFYHNYSILKEENEDIQKFRLILSYNTSKIIKMSFKLLGINVPERM
ncbi:arginine--tRNA ligase [Candidatus Azobacteroides pseudotrichonymphae]|uniref:Arginine--tRNA ligase n=1 Tax=Azobacteroides pseudotrichonymphae genomovar. CFP2 TaxID=511995 RepID=B6YPZ3_AZOPC|nr:arginine--tRNA ligase [Candidatus Azobacteroides pseudotrichonymphae]BAG83265.1 arginyl-tRNA synthetase [Candidatus Azobacteroides pseudotrichonymphae genomovar. CFP2]